MVMSFAPFHLQHGRRRIAVEINLGISEVGDDEDLVLLRQRHQRLVEIQGRHVGGGVGREIHDQRGRLRHGVAHRAVDGAQHLIIRRGGDGAHRSTRDDEAELMDGIRRVWHQNRVTRGGDGGGEVGEALLGAQRGDHLRLRVQLHAEAALIIGRLGAAQPGNPLGGGIAVAARVLHRLHQLGDDVGRRRAVGVAHAKIDNVLRASSRLGLGGIHFRKNIRGQAAYAVKLFGHFKLGLE